ncbi:hypothetical protein [uncultured Brachyspira sp.]|uniref:hypothetical protein n=1 Tax=uncultured Brachyspira sp. TaxID=221953 RepID=UPI0027DE8CB6|nr:hypothetical protein [uncultured Brachyspira sp.]
MKKLVLIIFLVGFSRVFPAFEVDVLGQLAASFGVPIAQPFYTNNTPPMTRTKFKGSTEARLSGSVQIGYQFPKTNSLKGVGVFCNIKIEQFSIGTSIDNGKNFLKKEGFNLGVGLATKFIFGSINSLVPRDTIIGFGLGAKVLVPTKFDFPSPIPPVITPYVDLFVEQRFFVARKLALVGGINVGIDFMIYQFTDDGTSLFGTYGPYMTAYPTLSIGLNIGLHFGN